LRLPGLFGANAGDRPEELASGSGNQAIREDRGSGPSGVWNADVDLVVLLSGNLGIKQRYYCELPHV
jgi:hypothetical protein